MVPQARSEATRQKLLDAAIDLFSEVGYAAAGLGEIIERAGMTKGALYHHFDSKDALATAIIEQSTNLTVPDSVQSSLVRNGRGLLRVSLEVVLYAVRSLAPTCLGRRWIGC